MFVCRSLASVSTSLAAETLDSKTFCGGIEGLERRQKKVCRQHVEMMSRVMAGAKMAVEECQHQFKTRRWNCSVIETETIFKAKVNEGKLNGTTETKPCMVSIKIHVIG